MGSASLIRNTARRLRQLEQQRLQLEMVDATVAQLPPADKLILQKLILYPERGNISLLAQLLELDETTLYRRRAALLHRLSQLLATPQTEN